jgi:HlyD family secretion protein
MTTRQEQEAAALRPAIDDGGADRRRRRMSHKRRMRWVKRIALTLIGLGVVLAIGRAFMPTAIPVDVAVARRGELSVYLEEDGRTRVRERYVVLAPVAGELVRVDVEPGTLVAEGDVLARMVQPPAQLLDARSQAEAEARLAVAQASERQAGTAVRRAAAAAELARREATRLRALAGQGVAAAADRDRADTQSEMAEHELAAARLASRVAAADVRLVRAALGQVRRGEPAVLEIRAPAAGHVLRVDRESAGPIGAGVPIVEIGDPRSVEAVIDVLSTEAVKVVVGAPASLEEWGGGRPLEGRVRTVEPSAFTRISALGIEEQRVNVIIALDDTPRELGDGFRVEARILLSRAASVLSVPSSALFRSGGNWAVYAVEGGRARLRQVSIGMRGRLDVEIARGLEADTPVIIYPGDRIRDGVRVRARPAGDP